MDWWDRLGVLFLWAIGALFVYSVITDAVYKGTLRALKEQQAERIRRENDD